MPEDTGDCSASDPFPFEAFAAGPAPFVNGDSTPQMVIRSKQTRSTL